MQCRASAYQSGLSVDLTLANGQRATVQFETPERPKFLEIRPQAGAANANYFLKADFDRETRLSYCAFAPKTVTPRENLRIIEESENSFLTRATCAEGTCDHAGFLENTESSDSNYFSTGGGLPDEKRPFGELDKTYLLDATRTYRTLISLIRGVPVEQRSFAEVCRALGGDPLAVGHQWAGPAPRTEPAATGGAR